jgi:hypothetical protein
MALIGPPAHAGPLRPWAVGALLVGVVLVWLE